LGLPGVLKRDTLGGVKAEIVSIGTELVLGQSLDTNGQWLAVRLTEMGFRVARHLTVSDDRKAIGDAIRTAADGAAVVMVTGGLGPTPDDVTREAAGDVVGAVLVLHEPSLAHIRRIFERVGRTMTPSNDRQAYLPIGADVIENPTGTAPGFGMTVDGARVFFLPGVPSEMRRMFDESVLPAIRDIPNVETACRTVRCFGQTESFVGEILADMMGDGRNPVVGITASEAVISLRITATANVIAEAETLANDDVREICGRLGATVFSTDGSSLVETVASRLRASGRTVATVESCTGGLLSKMLTDVPGSSGFFVGGYVTYSNDLKAKMVGVDTGLIDRCGAVSEEVAAAMAKGCLDRTAADYALSITGIAGPDGGTAEKPVGMVCFGLAGPRGVQTKTVLMGEHHSRSTIRDRSCHVSLDLINQEIPSV
jgi:competence/damage-inducible protein CinA-like protein